MKHYPKISILHISDLHKKESYDFKNLYQSIKDDCGRYMRQDIQKPNIIVVSGDLIRGGTSDEIKKQYKETKAFLDDLTSFFLDGDKNRMVIVPGNHDVDWNVTTKQMKPVNHETDEEKKNYKKLLELFLNEGPSKCRWSWEDQQLYNYEDNNIYNSRFALFADFYKSFYIDREYPLDPNEQFDIFDIPAYNICFIGFNSCHLNDHLNKMGQISPTCVTKASDRLKAQVDRGRILVAVWHHNTSGRPMENNYLDNRILNPIINMGVHIALHGHQHYSGVVEEYHNAFQNGKLLMFSTGSLYGTLETLPYGAPRQYNILELEKDGDKLVVTIHLRADKNSEEFEIPNWGYGNIKEIGSSCWKTTLHYPVQPLDEDKLSKLMNLGMETGDYSDVIEMLKESAETDEMNRKMMLDFMLKNGRYMDIIDFIGEPSNESDARIVLKAAHELNDREISKRVKNFHSIKYSTDVNIKKMKDYL